MLNLKVFGLGTLKERFFSSEEHIKYIYVYKTYLSINIYLKHKIKLN